MLINSKSQKILICLLLLVMVVVFLRFADEPRWIELTVNTTFPARDTAQPFVFGGEMYLSNGYVSAENPMVRDLWRSTDGSVWEEVLSATPYDGHAALTVHNGQIFAAKNTVWASSNGGNWDRITSDGPSDDEAALGRMVSFKGKLWFFEVDHIASSTDGVEWQHYTAPYGRRSGAAVVADNQFIYVLGGSIFAPNDPPETTYPGRTSFNDVWRSSDGEHWNRVVEHANWSPRIWPGAVMHDGQIYLFGGFDNVAGDNVGELWTSLDGVSWKQVETSREPSARHWPSMFSLHDGMYLAAGNGWPVTNDVWRYGRIVNILGVSVKF